MYKLYTKYNSNYITHWGAIVTKEKEISESIDRNLTTVRSAINRIYHIILANEESQISEALYEKHVFP